MTTESAAVAATTTEPEAPKPGTPEYSAAMIEKARGSKITQNGEVRIVGAQAASTETTATAAATETTQAVTATTAATETTAATTEVKPPVKPEGVPDKFWNATTGAVDFAAWNKSTTELEAHFTRSRQAEAARKKVETATAAVAAAATPEAKTAAETALGLAKAEQTVADAAPAPAPAAETTPAAKPLTFEQVQATATTEFSKDGKLSDATYASFEKIGVPKVAVDAFIEGQRATSASYITKIHEAGGGKAAYDSMIAWAQANYTPAEVTAFDGALRSMDAGQMTMAVNGLKARFTAANGSGGDLILAGGGGSNTGDSAFTTQQEMTAAMADPRYQKDPAYRAQVARKVANGRRTGNTLGINAFKSAMH